jgi:hypothetical protein
VSTGIHRSPLAFDFWFTNSVEGRLRPQLSSKLAVMLAVSCRATVNGALGFAISDIGAELARHPHPDTVSRVLSFANSHRLIGIRDDRSRPLRHDAAAY